MANKVGNKRSRRHGPNLGGGLRTTLSLDDVHQKDSMHSSSTSLTSTSLSEVVVISPPKTRNLKRKVRFAEEYNQFYEPFKVSSRHTNISEEDHSGSSISSTWYTRNDIARFQDETERQAFLFLEHDARAGELYGLYQSFLLPQPKQPQKTRASPQPEDAAAMRTTPQSLRGSSWRDAAAAHDDDDDDDDEDNHVTMMIRGLEGYALPSRDPTFWKGFRELQARKHANLYYKLFPERLSVTLAHYCRQHSRPSQLYAWNIVVAGDTSSRQANEQRKQ